MNKTLLVLASLAAAGVAMAADGGTLTFKSYLAAANNMKAVSSEGTTISSPDWMLQLLDASGSPVMGTKVGGAGALEPVKASFNGTTGYVTSGGDWALQGFNQGQAYDFALGAYYAMGPGATDYASATLKGASPMFRVTLGGADLTPPGPAGSFAFGGAQTFTVTVPEPSVLALGLLGMGAFLIRRRS